MAAPNHVYSDLYLSSPEHNYDDETETSTNNLMDILQGGDNMLSATKIPNYNEHHHQQTSTKRKAESMVETSTSNKRAKATKKTNVDVKKSTEKRSQPQQMQRHISPSNETKQSHASQPTKTQTDHTSPKSKSYASDPTEKRQFDNLYEFNKLKEQKKQRYLLLSTRIDAVDNAIRKFDECGQKENLMNDNTFQLCEKKSSEFKEQLVNMKKYYNKLLKDNAPDICLVCNSAEATIVGNCNHCFICFTCYVEYMNKALSNKLRHICCVKCGQMVYTITMTHGES